METPTEIKTTVKMVAKSMEIRTEYIPNTS
jgi:hypothetical protein